MWRAFLAADSSAHNRILEIAEARADETIITDRELLLRVLVNGVKNALEATPTGGTVTVRYEAGPEWQQFHIHNAGVLPEKVALRIFQRSFSTKDGSGHGLGTYSMRLFTERHLGGAISFESTVQAGTVFTVALPQSGPQTSTPPPSPSSPTRQ